MLAFVFFSLHSSFLHIKHKLKMDVVFLQLSILRRALLLLRLILLFSSPFWSTFIKKLYLIIRHYTVLPPTIYTTLCITSVYIVSRFYLLSLSKCVFASTYMHTANNINNNEEKSNKNKSQRMRESERKPRSASIILTNRMKCISHAITKYIDQSSIEICIERNEKKW